MLEHISLGIPKEQIWYRWDGEVRIPERDQKPLWAVDHDSVSSSQLVHKIREMVQGAQNQSLAVQVDVGFLGSLGQWIHCRPVQLSRTRLLDRLAELCQSFKESLRSSTRVWIAVMQDYSSARLTKRHAGPKCRFSEVCKNL